jgi:hypothetical protein
MKTRSVLLIYGEQTETLSIRVPKSKKKEIEKLFQEILKKYENPQRVEIDVVLSQQKNNDIASTEPSKKKSTASGNDKWKDVRATDEEVAEALSNVKVTPEVKFEKIASLPLGTELLESFGSKGALRVSSDDNYYTKRTHNGKLEILKHENYQSAVLYANENFK